MTYLVPGLDLIVSAIAAATMLILRGVAALAPSMALRRAWWVLGGMLACCIALLFAHASVTLARPPNAADLVAGTIFLVGVLFIYATAWLSRRTARDMLRMRGMAQDAYRDALTGIGNRRCFGEALQAAISDSDRLGRPLGVVALDVDRFKAVNDTYGHAAGDAVLRAVAAALMDGIRPVDTVCRVGGEEFAVILPGLEPPFAMLLAERLRAAVAALRIPMDGARELGVTISLGLASREYGEPGPGLLHRADAALYTAKRGGRDCVKLAV